MLECRGSDTSTYGKMKTLRYICAIKSAYFVLSRKFILHGQKSKLACYMLKIYILQSWYLKFEDLKSSIYCACRRCLRRQSMRLKHPENQDDLFEIDVANSPVKQTVDSKHRKSDSDVVDYETCLSDSSKGEGSQRLSIGRPQRRAAEKVQSYKDPPLNTKMRRP